MSYDSSQDEYDDPASSVLDNGLPELPESLEPGHGIAAARWVDGDFGVVLCVYRRVPDADDDPVDFDEYGYDVRGYFRHNGEWEALNGSGGSSWPDPPFARLSELRQYGIASGHMHAEGAGNELVRIADGFAGPGVMTIEVSHNGAVTQMPVESPIGAWVVGVVGEGPAAWTARDADGRIAATGKFNEPRTSDAVFDWLKQNIEIDAVPPEVFEHLNGLQERQQRDPREIYIPAERVEEWQRIATDFHDWTGRMIELRAFPAIGFPDATEYEVWIDAEHVGSVEQMYDDEYPEASLTELAEQLCVEHLHEFINGGWPTCPEHNTHPLEPQFINDVAVWECPKGDVVVRIGELRTVDPQR